MNYTNSVFILNWLIELSINSLMIYLLITDLGFWGFGAILWQPEAILSFSVINLRKIDLFKAYIFKIKQTYFELHNANGASYK